MPRGSQGHLALHMYSLIPLIIASSISPKVFLVAEKTKFSDVTAMLFIRLLNWLSVFYRSEFVNDSF